MANTPIKVDQDPVETQEWLQAYESVLLLEGPDRAAYLLNQLVARSGKEGSNIPVAMTTPYRNTIPLQAEARMPGDLFMERRIRSLIRWNALAMVIRANKSGDDLGGHIATYQSAATLYEVGFNYFWTRSRAASPVLILRACQRTISGCRCTPWCSTRTEGAPESPDAHNSIRLRLLRPELVPSSLGSL